VAGFQLRSNYQSTLPQFSYRNSQSFRAYNLEECLPETTFERPACGRWHTADNQAPIFLGSRKSHVFDVLYP
jgi:hypothetical protein